MYVIQIFCKWKDPPEWLALATYKDRELAERERDRLTRSGDEVRLVNDADDVEGGE